MDEDKKYTVYRVYYGDRVVYVGRTSQDISRFVNSMIMGKSKLDIDRITDIDSHEFVNDADSRLYCLYETVRLKPELNIDVANDDPLVSLPDIGWVSIWANGKDYARIASERQSHVRKLESRLKELQKFYAEFEGRYKSGNISLEDYVLFNNALNAENLTIRQAIDKEAETDVAGCS